MLYEIILHNHELISILVDKGRFGKFSTLDDSPYPSDYSPKSSKVGAFLPRPPPFREKIFVSGHQKSRKGTNPIRLNDAIPSFFPSEGVLLSIQPYILTFYQSKHAKITTQASYQNLGGYMANPVDYDTRDSCTRGCRNGCILHPKIVLGMGYTSYRH